MVMRDLVLKNKRLQHDHQKEFMDFFGVLLETYMDTITGFDIIAFDNWLGTPDGVSTEDHLIRVYGFQSVNLIRSLI